MRRAVSDGCWWSLLQRLRCSAPPLIDPARLSAAAAEVNIPQPEGMSGEIQVPHRDLLDALGNHAKIMAMSDGEAAAWAFRFVQVFAVIAMHHGP